MEIKLDNHYTIIDGYHGGVQLVKHKVNPDHDKSGHPVGDKLFFQTYGQAVKSYIQLSAADEDIQTLRELSVFIDKKFEVVKEQIDHLVGGYSNDD